MNRIQLSPLASAKLPRPENPNQVAESPSKFSISRQHQTFLPLHFEGNYAYPLIVWLHSAGDDPQQLLRVMPSISLRNYCAVAPEGTSGSAYQGFYWDQHPHSIELAQRTIEEAIAQVSRRVRIAPQRIFLVGSGMGGSMALRVAMRTPERFAGVASLNGPLPQGCNPLGNLKHSRKLPVLWAHCRESLEFPENQLCDQLKLLHIAGFNVTVRQYPFGDELPALALKDVDRWIMEFIDSAIV